MDTTIEYASTHTHTEKLYKYVPVQGARHIQHHLLVKTICNAKTRRLLTADNDQDISSLLRKWLTAFHDRADPR